MGHVLSVQHISGSRAGTRESFKEKVVRAGRDPACDIRFHTDQDLDVSAAHAEIRRGRKGYRILDLGSTNGTYVNGSKVVEKDLASGDQIRFGRGGPRIKITITRKRRILPVLLVLGALVLLVGIIFGAVLIFSGGDEGPAPKTPGDPVPATNALVAVRGRAYYSTRMGEEVVAEEWGTGLVVSAKGLVLVPKHVVRPWKFDSEAAAKFKHYGDRVKTVVTAWKGGVPFDDARGWSTEAGTLEVQEASDVLEAAPRRIKFLAGGREVAEDVQIHVPGSYDAALLRLKGGPLPCLGLTGEGRLPEGAESVRILGQVGSPDEVEMLVPEISDRGVLKVFDDAFELEVGPRLWSGTIALWEGEPVGLYSYGTGRYVSIDSIRKALVLEEEK